MHRTFTRRATFDGSLARLGGPPSSRAANADGKSSRENRAAADVHACTRTLQRTEREREGGERRGAEGEGAYCSVRALAGLRHGRVYH